MLEVKTFRERVIAWLRGITGMSAYIGSGSSARAYFGWPQKAPAWSLITCSMNRTPTHEYSFHGWGGQLTMAITDPDVDKLDAIEDLITEWLADNTNNPTDTLSAAGSITCAMFQLIEVQADVQTQSMEDGSYQFTTRQLVFDYVIVGLSEG